MRPYTNVWAKRTNNIHNTKRMQLKYTNNIYSQHNKDYKNYAYDYLFIRTDVMWVGISYRKHSIGILFKKGKFIFSTNKMF